MQPTTLLLILLMLTFAAYQFGMRRSVALVEGKIRELHSLPSYYGVFTALWAFLPAFLVFVVWTSMEAPVITHLVVSALPEELHSLEPDRMNLVVNDIRNLVKGNIVSGDVTPAIQVAADRYGILQQRSAALLSWVVFALSVGGGVLAWRSIAQHQRARNAVERAITGFLIASSTLAIFTTLGIVLSVLFESLRFFNSVPVTDFLFGLEWSPQTAIRADQVGSSGAFGAVPLFAGTLLISLLAMLVAVPVGLMSAIYLSEYADRKVRTLAKPPVAMRFVAA